MISRRGLNGLEEALESILKQASKAIDEETNIIILSDRESNEENAPIPALLACSFVNQWSSKNAKSF